MPVPIHPAMREDPTPPQASGERALLDQMARLALADERWQRQHRHSDSTRPSRSWPAWNRAPLKVACAVILLVVGLGAVASNVSAMPGTWSHMTLAGDGEMRSGGGQILPTTRTPATGHHYTGHQLGRRAAIPTSATAPPSSAKSTSPGSAFHYTGRQFRRRAAHQPSLLTTRSSGKFDWADASVGAGVTAALGLSVAAATLRLNRRRMQSQLTA